MFRNVRFFIPFESSCSVLCEVQNDRVVLSNLNKDLPCSNDYSLSDLLSSGVKVAPIEPTVLHDSESTNVVAHHVIDNFVDDIKDN